MHINMDDDSRALPTDRSFFSHYSMPYNNRKYGNIYYDNFIYYWDFFTREISPSATHIPKLKRHSIKVTKYLSLSLSLPLPPVTLRFRFEFFSCFYAIKRYELWVIQNIEELNYTKDECNSHLAAITNVHNARARLRLFWLLVVFLVRLRQFMNFVLCHRCIQPLRHIEYRKCKHYECLMDKRMIQWGPLSTVHCKLCSLVSVFFFFCHGATYISIPFTVQSIPTIFNLWFVHVVRTFGDDGNKNKIRFVARRSERSSSSLCGEIKLGVYCIYFVSRLCSADTATCAQWQCKLHRRWIILYVLNKCQ